MHEKKKLPPNIHGLVIGDKAWRQSGDEDKGPDSDGWVQFTVNATYMELMAEHPDDYRRHHPPLRPINDRIVVLPDEGLEITEGGIIIPETAKDKATTGTVVYVGPNADQVITGDRVLYGKYSGQDMDYKGFKYALMREDDVMVVLTDDMPLTERKELPQRPKLPPVVQKHKAGGEGHYGKVENRSQLGEK